MRSLRRAAGVFSVVVTVVLSASVVSARDGLQRDDRLWDALRGGGHVVLLRHALAPGTGDPPGFRIGDCSTQRNLSAEGRSQAVAIGKLFRANAVPVGRVLTSQWCRCRETAELLDLAPVEEYPVLNSFFSDPTSAAAQTAELRRFVGRKVAGPNIVLVTHQVNITELTGVFPASGEMVVIRPDGEGSFVSAGRLLLSE